MSEQLIELMLQLKKTTPAAAKQILNSQPQIAYALITLMVSMNAINLEVFQKTLADFAASQATSQPHPPAPQNYPRTAPAPDVPYSHGQPQPPINPAVLAAIPEDQRAMVLQVLSMTPEQLALLPPQDRANIMQLRASFGL
ncbi:hypothetical protein BT96DRAFT_856375 [Gymnopus androsaceus JB14]|uniref:Cleavage stimulation factor subunit 2 hinge domain-containing protein n=1 Tax=Gymnopus androsaceus JB14 TaxID=1447944 RepID=A0A6A4HV90_9AGAR|nr:hypothetical protein BT96DRAFT_856375 [Gymnopus androsaceus JB14]